MTDDISVPKILSIQDNKNSSGNRHETLQELYYKIYPDVINHLRSQGLDCDREGYAIVCKSCPKHPDEKYDMLILDILAPTNITQDSQLFWTCAKDPFTYTDQYHTFTEEEMKIIRSAKPFQNEINKTRTEMIVHHYLATHYVITIKQEERYAIFVYDENEGKYKLKGGEVLKGELIKIYDSLYHDTDASPTLLETAIMKIAEWTVRSDNMDIFEHDDGDVYYIPARKKDVKISRKNGTIEFVDKDPINRPFLSALPYDFTEPVPDKMPPELEEMLSLVPDAFFDDFLFELVSPLAFKPQHYVIVNFSRVSKTGKSTVLKRMRELYGDLVFWTEASRLGERFEKSAYLGKSAVLIDEYEGGGLGTKRQFKTLTSDNELTVEVKYGPVLNVKNKLSVVVNTNVLGFSNFDIAFLERIVLIPFIRNFKTTEHIAEWDEKTKERIILYLIKHILPRYFSEIPKQYPPELLAKWMKDPKTPPDDGIIDFLNRYAYAEYNKNNNQGVLVAIPEAYYQYMYWSSRNDYVPVTFDEFINKLRKLRDNTGKWLVGEDKICLKKDIFTFQ